MKTFAMLAALILGVGSFAMAQDHKKPPMKHPATMATHHTTHHRSTHHKSKHHATHHTMHRTTHHTPPPPPTGPKPKHH